MKQYQPSPESSGEPTTQEREELRRQRDIYWRRLSEVLSILGADESDEGPALARQRMAELARAESSLREARQERDALRKELETAKADGWCDACCGTGKPAESSGEPTTQGAEGDPERQEHVRDRWNYSGQPSERLTDGQVITDIVACAESWEPGARLLGNIRAVDIARALRTLLVESQERDALRKERDEARRDHAETGALLEAMCAAVAGEPVSDFMESFAPIRQAVDLRAQLATLTAIRRWPCCGADVDEAHPITSPEQHGDCPLATLTAEGRAEALREAADLVERTNVIHGDHYASYSAPSVDAKVLADAIRARARSLTQPREEGR